MNGDTFYFDHNGRNIRVHLYKWMKKFQTYYDIYWIEDVETGYDVTEELKEEALERLDYAWI